MRILKLFSILFIFGLAGCSTHHVNLNYQSAPLIEKQAPAISKVNVIDNRETDNDWLGAIRGGYGNRLKTLRTNGPTNLAVTKVFQQALTENGLHAGNGQGIYELIVIINKFDCSYYFNREAHTHLDVTVTQIQNQEVVLRKKFTSDDTESGVGAGIFGSVDTLANLAERSLSNAINKILLDPDFYKLMQQSKANSELSNSESPINLKIQSLQQEKLSYEEYQRRYREITQDAQ